MKLSSDFSRGVYTGPYHCRPWLWCDETLWSSFHHAEPIQMRWLGSGLISYEWTLPWTPLVALREFSPDQRANLLNTACFLAARARACCNSWRSPPVSRRRQVVALRRLLLNGGADSPASRATSGGARGNTRPIDCRSGERAVCAASHPDQEPRRRGDGHGVIAHGPQPWSLGLAS